MRGLLSILLMLSAISAHAVVEVETANLQLRFADNGDLVSAHACLPGCDGSEVHDMTFGAGQTPATVSFTSFATESFSLHRDEDAATVSLVFQGDGGSRRTWVIPRSGFRLELASSGSERLDLAGGESLRPPPAAGFGIWLEGLRYVLIDDDDVTQVGLDEATDLAETVGWTGFRNRFWTLMALPGQSTEFGLNTGANVQAAGVVMATDPADTTRFSLYLGPIEPEALRSADPALHGLMYAGIWFWLRWIAMGLHWLLGFIHAFVPVWGVAIMALSVSVNILMRPLSNIADRLQNQVHETEGRLAPELREIQKTYKGEEQSKRILALYKQHGVHPLYSLKSLAGVAVIIPVFIGAFDMLAENIWLAGESFLWIADLARPDAVASLPFTIPFFGAQLNLLPFVMTALSVLASGLHHHEAMDDVQRRKQRRNLILMALAFLALFYTFPAGMVLYWTTNNLISVIKYGWRRRQNAGTTA